MKLKTKENRTHTGQLGQLTQNYLLALAAAVVLFLR